MELLGHATSRQSPALEVLIVAAQTVYSFLEKLMKQLPVVSQISFNSKQNTEIKSTRQYICYYIVIFYGNTTWIIYCYIYLLLFIRVSIKYYYMLRFHQAYIQVFNICYCLLCYNHLHERSRGLTIHLSVIQLSSHFHVL